MSSFAVLHITSLPGGGVDYKLLKNYFEYLLRQ